MEPVNVKVKDAFSIEISHTDLYKELERLNLSANSKKKPNGYKKKSVPLGISTNANYKFEKVSSSVTQYDLFQKSMKLLLIFGQSIGLNPVSGILNDSEKIRFKLLSCRLLYSVGICGVLGVATILCIYRLLRKTINITMLGFVSFYGSTCITTFLFLRVAAKWPKLMKEIKMSELDEYVDASIMMKCNVATATLLLMGLFEHILSIIAKQSVVLDCFPDEGDVYKGAILNNFPWFFELGFPYFFPIGVALQCVNITAALNWNYSDVFIICVSLYLSSILKQINCKIAINKNKNLPISFWRSIREDYTRATRLVRCFDDVISGVVFSSLATNLFFICLQLFKILANGISSRQSTNCPNYPSGLFNGAENVIYFSYSLVFLLGRSLVVWLCAADVHQSSLEVAPALYDLPTDMYFDEVQRFIEQVHVDTVALSGLQFFYVTKELVLSVAGTIVTYELVLLQFNGEA